MRMYSKIAMTSLGLLTFVGVPMAGADAPSDYTVTDLGIVPGSLSSSARAINKHGVVVGESYYQVDPVPHAWKWEDGTFTDLGTLGGVWSAARSINQHGAIVGMADSLSNTHAFLWQDGVMTNLGGTEAKDINKHGTIVGRRGAFAVVWQGGVMSDLPSLVGEGGRCSALGINDRGHIVGDSVSLEGPEHACLWIDGVPTDLGAPGGRTSVARAINDKGLIVGMLEFAAAPPKAVIWQDGVMTTIGGSSSQAWDVNDRGQVVGEWLGPTTGAPRGFVWEDGVMTELLPLPGHERSTAFGINEHGDIVGWSLDQDTVPGTAHAVVWSR